MDMDAFMTRFDATLKEGIQAGVKAALPQAPPRPTVAPKSDPVQDLVMEAVGPQLQAIQVTALAGADAANFFTSTPEINTPEYAKHKEEVERRFMGALAQGRFVPRGDLYKHYMGENFDAFATLRAKTATESQNAALRAAGAPGANVGQSGTMQIADPYSMTEDQLFAALAPTGAKAHEF
jgi:hypothetical protein